MENETNEKAEGDGARARVALWKAALREGPGEAPGPAGRALLAALRKLWLAREAEQRRAMREPPFAIPDTLAVRPLEGRLFFMCSSLQNIKFPPHLESVAPDALPGCRFSEETERRLTTLGWDPEFDEWTARNPGRSADDVTS